MTRFGYFLSSEECTPQQLVSQAKAAEEAGFEALWISDHFHPWNDEQGQSPFVWSVIGAISQVCSLPITTAVTCPTVRTHPAVIAQAAATSAVLTGGRFTLGVGSGEALNEHILGDPWPSADIRLAMLEESIALMRELWQGQDTDWDGDHYHLENARIYTRPDQPIPVYVSAFGPKAAELAGRVGDGFISTKPDKDLIARFHRAGGLGKPLQGGLKVCWAPDEETGVEEAHRLWAHSGAPGELSQVLPSPKHFEQLAQLVTPEMTRESTACGPDASRHVRAVREYVDAGYDEVYVSQMGTDFHDGFFEAYRDEVLPQLRS